MNRDISRRTFLTRVSAASAASTLILPRLSFAAPPSSKLQHGAIGVGGQGASDLREIAGSGKVEVVALCDIDSEKLNAAAAHFPGARLYRDWREMLSQEEGQLDSLNIATPDHSHAPAAMTALRMRKHVFCEKPLTHEVYEARRLTEAAREAGVATQMGIQIHAHDYYRTAVQWVREGAIGRVMEWHSWSSAQYTTESKQRPAGSDPVPPNVDWDLWLGTAPERPYKAGVYHPFEWRRWRDFGSGATGDFGCHIFDPVFTALGVGAPLSVRCEAESYSDEVWPGWAVAHYEFPGTPLTSGRTIRATWRDGGKKPSTTLSRDLPEGYEFPASGSMLMGEEGTLIIPHIDKPQLHPQEKFAKYPTPDLEPKNHYHEFVDAAMGTGKAGANFDFSGPLAEAVLLANVANQFPGETLEWDAADLRFPDNATATKLLKRNYRDGWEVKGL